jgi:hypothetical protein
VIIPILINIEFANYGNTAETSQFLRGGRYRTAHGEMTGGEAPRWPANSKARKMGAFALVGYPQSISFTVEHAPRPNALQVSTGVGCLLSQQVAAALK